MSAPQTLPTDVRATRAAEYLGYTGATPPQRVGRFMGDYFNREGRSAVALRDALLSWR